MSKVKTRLYLDDRYAGEIISFNEVPRRTAGSAALKIKVNDMEVIRDCYRSNARIKTRIEYEDGSSLISEAIFVFYTLIADSDLIMIHLGFTKEFIEVKAV